MVVVEEEVVVGEEVVVLEVVLDLEEHFTHGPVHLLVEEVAVEEEVVEVTVASVQEAVKELVVDLFIRESNLCNILPIVAPMLSTTCNVLCLQRSLSVCETSFEV